MVVIVEGGVCRRPGPSLSGTEALEGTGRTSSERISPGITNAWEVMAVKKKHVSTAERL